MVKIVINWDQCILCFPNYVSVYTCVLVCVCVCVCVCVSVCVCVYIGGGVCGVAQGM